MLVWKHLEEVILILLTKFFNSFAILYAVEILGRALALCQIFKSVGPPNWSVKNANSLSSSTT